MNHGLLNYRQASAALLPKKVSVRSLRRYASLSTPFKKRLVVVRLSSRNVGIKPLELEKWKARCSGEII